MHLRSLRNALVNLQKNYPELRKIMQVQQHQMVLLLQKFNYFPMPTDS